MPTAGAAKALSQIRPDLDRLIRTYLRRSGTYRVNELLESLYRTAGPEGLRWIVDLSAAAPVRSELLLSVVRQPWIPAAQREPLYREILSIAEADVAAKAGEARNDAETVINATEKTLRRPDFAEIASVDLQSGERERIESTLNALKQVMTGNDRDAIRDATHELNHATQHLAEVMMNRGVREALAGKNVEDV